METPWLNLNPSGPPYVLEIDQNYVQQHNERSRPEHQIMVNALPEPFIGDPETARVVLLNLNPGYDNTVDENHRRPEIKAAIFLNLRQAPNREYPCYAFDPAFEGTGVANYWREYTQRLQYEVCVNDPQFAKRLLVIEWFPYPSAKFGIGPGDFCESQKYSFHLAKQMLARPDVQIVGTCGRSYRLRVDPTFGLVPFLNNWQRPWITRGNMDSDVYDRIVQILKEDIQH